MDAKTAKTPEHELVYRRLREMILCGELEPGQAVTIQGLIASLGAGMTPVREAIRRLTAAGALDFQGNRRVSVPVLTRGQVEELAFARIALEPQLAFEAASRANPDDIARLEAIDADINRAIERGDVRGYLMQNHVFHQQLYALSGSEILRAVADNLWLRMGPSLRVMAGRFGTSNLPDRHVDAIAGLRQGDADAVREAIRADIAQGFDHIRASLHR